MSRPNIIKFAPTPYPDLIQQVGQLLSEHPEADELTCTCHRLALLIVQIDDSLPSYAQALERRLRRRLRRCRRASPPLPRPCA